MRLLSRDQLAELEDRLEKIGQGLVANVVHGFLEEMGLEVTGTHVDNEMAEFYFQRIRGGRTTSDSLVMFFICQEWSIQD